MISPTFKSLFMLAAMASTGMPANDVVFQALEDEMARSKGLQLPGHEKPFMIEYVVRDSDSFAAASSFGAITGEHCTHSRGLNTDVVLGDYKINSARSQFGGGGALMALLAALAHNRNVGSTALPIDDNYFALRRIIWQDTDTKYKSAVENFAAKKAYMAQNKIVDRPDDLSKADPVVLIQPVKQLNVDQPLWDRNLKQLSAIFRSYPHIQRSIVSFSSTVENRWYLNSEGFKNRISRPLTMLNVIASANRDDGSKAADSKVFITESADQLPNEQELEKGVKALADNIEHLRTAKQAEEDYDGPVLLEGEASAQFLGDVLATQLGNSQENYGFPGPSGNQWKEKLGLKLMPEFISVIDDPSAKEFNHIPIYSHKEIDDDGLRPEKLTLIDHGVLKTFCMSRVPTRQLSKSNGHSVNGVGMPTTLFLMAEKPATLKQLRDKLLQEGKEQGLKYVYVVRRMTNLFSAMQGGQLGDIVMMGSMTASPPLDIYQVSVADGHEELVRDLSFGHLTQRVLKDIELAANDARPYTTMSRAGSTTFVAPSILIKEVELQKRQGKPTKNEPILENPYFEKQK